MSWKVKTFFSFLTVGGQFVSTKLTGDWKSRGASLSQSVYIAHQTDTFLRDQQFSKSLNKPQTKHYDIVDIFLHADYSDVSFHFFLYTYILKAYTCNILAVEELWDGMGC